MAMTGELEFYAAGSGLPADATLNEHQRAYWAAQGPVASPELLSHTELEAEFYRAKLVDDQPTESLVDLRYRYFAGISTLAAGNAVNDDMVEVFT